MILNAQRTGSTTIIHWTSRELGTPVKIYRDGNLLVTDSSSGTFTDHLNTDLPVHYVADMSRELLPNEVSEISDPSVRESAEKNPSNFELVDVLGVTISNGNSIADSANASPSAAATYFRYQTFIPMATVQAPPAGCMLNSTTAITANDYFLGDNRSFGPTATTYRTRLEATINWTTGTLTGARDVGTTHLEKANLDFMGTPTGTFTLYTKTAPNTSMQVTDTGTTTSVSHFTLDQNVSDPYCGSNGISVHVSVNVARSGAYSMYGNRIQVPSHEVYIKDSDAASWTPVMKVTATNYFLCLVPGAACDAPVSITGNR